MDKLILTVASSRRSLTWTPVEMSIGELWVRLRQPLVGAETMDEFLRLPKAQQDALKDAAGGFVGGELDGSRRKASAVKGRQLVTLDFDSIPPYKTDDTLAKVRALGVQYCVHGTRKHRPEEPRLRVLIPLDRTVTADEYEPIARRVADSIGIGMADPTTYEPCRLMYWPTVCSDVDYLWEATDTGDLLSADGMLGTYADWHDVASWPHAPGEQVDVRHTMAKQGDPLAKDGVVGAFCRTYDVISAMDLIPGMYAEAGEGRYTYTGGTTTGGAVVYEGGKYLYSHHATDPCCGQLVNAFDLIRIHKFGDLDTDPNKPVTLLPSYKAMVDFAMADDAVATLMIRERREQAAKEFNALGAADTQEIAVEDADWEKRLRKTPKGAIAQTIDNVATILTMDPNLSGKVAYDMFYNRRMVYDRLPWDRPRYKGAWTDADQDGLYWYLEKNYMIDKRAAIDSALNSYTAKHARDALREYIESLPVWDGTERLDTMLITYLGAEDTPYTRTITRKSLVAAVKRALEPGCKYDNMTILYGAQGVGKSTLIATLGGDFFTDCLSSFEGKDAQEMLAGVWMIEIAELDAMHKSESSRVKQFLSMRTDSYRAAYGHYKEDHPRRCVFWGTCNRDIFLRDVTGNRRFWIIDCGVQPLQKSAYVDGDLETERTQIWAEAVYRYRHGESTVLTREMETVAKAIQDRHADQIPMYGQIQDFVNRQIPSDWDSWSVDKRLLYWAARDRGEPVEDGITLVDRRKVCSMEIWRECLGQTSLLRAASIDARDISTVLSQLEGWCLGNRTTCGVYGLQRAYHRLPV